MCICKELFEKKFLKIKQIQIVHCPWACLSMWGSGKMCIEFYSYFALILSNLKTATKQLYYI